MSGRNQSRQVAGRTTTDESTTRIRAEASQICDPAQCLIFCVRSAGTLEPGTAANTGGTYNEVEERRCLRRGCRDEG